jgi:hypothetical protein
MEECYEKTKKLFEENRKEDLKRWVFDGICV